MESVRLYLGCLMMLAFVYGALSQNCGDVVGKIGVCFTNQGFPAPPVQIEAVGLPPLAGMTDGLGASACSSNLRSNLTEAVKCALQVVRDCVPQIRAITTNPDQAEDMAIFECEQVGLDMDCINQTLFSQDVFSCIREAQQNPAQVGCDSIDNMYQCAEPAVEKCGCAEVNYLAKYGTGSLRAANCGESILVVPDKCGGGAAILSHPAMLLLSLFVIIFRS